MHMEMVESERKKLLKEAASARLIEFLPSGLLKQEDLEMLGNEMDPEILLKIRKASEPKKDDPLAELEKYYSTNSGGSANNYINKT